MGPSELTPAEFEGAPTNRYRPGLPWRRIGFVVLVAALLVGAYLWRQKVRADALRERLHALHAAEVAPTLDALEATTADLREKAGSARAGAAKRLVEADEPLSALHERTVVYLRIRASELRTDEGLQAAIADASDDAVGACLGLRLTPLSALSDVPEVLTRQWLDRSNDTNDMRRLSVREEQLRRAIDRELPSLRALVPASHFLLLVVQGQDRLQDPVDVFLWDLESNTLELRSRAENRGRLIRVRSQIGPKAGDAAAEGDPVAAADCSIAAHIKALLGEPTMELEGSD